MSSNYDKWKELWEIKPINKYTLNTEQTAWLKHVKTIGDEMNQSNLVLNSIIKATEKILQETMAFIALEKLLPKYYDWCRENYWRSIQEKKKV